MKRMKVRLTFVTEVLGTSPADPELYDRFVASKAPDAQTRAEEVAAIGVDEATERGMTVFPHDGRDRPVFYSYQIRGGLKGAAAALREVPGSLAHKSRLKAYKKHIDRYVFVEPSVIPIDVHGGEVDVCQRPLRASTPQGERVSLASSEAAPAGSTIEFEVVCLLDEDVDLVKELLDYFRWCGLGQWRGSGEKGRATWELLDG